jgi:hypothetical protein
LLRLIFGAHGCQRGERKKREGDAGMPQRRTDGHVVFLLLPAIELALAGLAQHSRHLPPLPQNCDKSASYASASRPVMPAEGSSAISTSTAKVV